ncbi:MAG TPA: ATP-binding protein [Ramlibacter sp.]|nr:ATP-binding protein [Ramlibacter sp.]
MPYDTVAAVSWTTVVWSMLAAASLTLAAVHLPVWLRHRSPLPGVFFTSMCAATAGLAVCEVGLMNAHHPQDYANILLWMHVPIWLVLVSMVGFVYTYLGAGRLWLAAAAIGVRTVALGLNFSTGVNANFLEITGLRRVPIWGDMVSLPVGTPSPSMAVLQLGLWLCVAFIADAGITAWRRGERGKALRVSGAAVFFIVAGGLQALVRVWTRLELPPTASLFFVGIVLAMAYELSRDLIRSQKLARDLSESEERMVLAVGAANVGIWSRDLVNNETWASAQWRELAGFAPGEPVTAERMLEKIHPDDRSRMRRVLVDLQAPDGSYDAEFRVMMPGGEARWIASRGVVEFDARGRPVRTRGASMDCTARKHAEQETVLLRQEIAHVGRVSVMGQLASGLAHEINQPLGAILRNAEAAVLFLKRDPPDLDEVAAILDDIRKDDQRAGAVIDRMRALLRRQGVDMRPLGVDELFGDIAALLRPEATARHVKLELSIGREVPQVAGDRVHLQQVLLNLVSNGLDSIDEARRQHRSIVVSARSDGGKSVEIAVSDSGRGIAANDMGQLFEPFFTTKPKGMGMGLSISRTIVEAHGGRLWAENHPGGGARFLFTVPAAREVVRR